MKQPQINFRFSKNWRSFLKWYEAYEKKNKHAPIWMIQKLLIESNFEPDNPSIVDWKKLWIDYDLWFNELIKTKRSIIWSEQKRQIETLMLEQLKELNKEQYILVFLNRGKPEADVQKMTYFDAIRVKQDLIGDKNGRGGNEDLDKITIVNLNRLIEHGEINQTTNK